MEQLASSNKFNNLVSRLSVYWFFILAKAASALVRTKHMRRFFGWQASNGCFRCLYFNLGHLNWHWGEKWWHRNRRKHKIQALGGAGTLTRIQENLKGYITLLLFGLRFLFARYYLSLFLPQAAYQRAIFLSLLFLFRSALTPKNFRMGGLHKKIGCCWIRIQDPSDIADSSNHYA